MAHIYQTKICTNDNLESVLTAIEHFNFDRLVCAFEERKYMPITDILRMDARIMESTAKLQDECANLNEKAPNFNKRFVHKNNHYFSSTETLLKNIHSGVSCLKKVFSQLTPNRADALPASYTGQPPIIYERSVLGNLEYTPNLFQEHVRPEIKKLYDHLKEFLSILEDALKICQEVLEEEKSIRQMPKKCAHLYYQFKEDHRTHINHLVKQIATTWNQIEDIYNPAICLREKATSDEDFAQQGFHNLNYEDTCQLATKEIIEESLRGDFTKEELILFPDNREQILRVRYIITHFDNYLPKGYKRQTLPASLIACLLRWAQPTEDFAFWKYFKQTYTTAGNPYKVPNNSAINVQKNKLYDMPKAYDAVIKTWEQIEI